MGNPGERFLSTRHNVGFDVVTALAASRAVTLRKALLRPVIWSGPGRQTLVMPLTYMNRSGRVLPWLMRRTGAVAEDILVVTDNMDLAPGVIRLKRGGTSRSHNGIASVIDAVGPGFYRLYIGIGRPEGATVVDHVLAVPDRAEREAIDDAIARAVVAIDMLLDTSPADVMNAVNRRR